MLSTHKIRLDPTNKQIGTLNRYMGAARWVYNQTKVLSEKHYSETGKGLSKYDLRNKVVQELKPANPWLYEVPKGVTNYAVFNYHSALTEFFIGRNKYPKFHSRKDGNGSFSIENDKVKVDGKKIRLPLLGWVRMVESLRFNGSIKTITVTQHNHKFYASLTVEIEQIPLPQTGGAVGVDVNLSAIVDSNSNYYLQPRAYKVAERKLKRLQKMVSRKQQGSQNQKKAIRKLADAHKRITNIRSDFAHKLSHHYVKENSIIGIETLSVANMLKNHKLAKHVQDAGFSQFLRMLKYKAVMHDRLIVEANRFYPSSKTCSNCGIVKTKLSLSERRFTCEECGFNSHRDENAAINLFNLAVGFTENKNACGENVSLNENFLAQQFSEKQETIAIYKNR